MALTEQLTNLRNQFFATQPEAITEPMIKATTDLINSQIAEQSLSVGAKIPNFTLPNAVENKIDIKSLLEKGVLVISFYRGGWCPYCNLELRALQQFLGEIEAQGATLVAISPETPDNSLSTKEKNELTFEVLSDIGNQVAKQFGLVFTLPEIVRPIYEQFGIDLPAYNGDSTFQLPIPATYIIKPDGTIAYSFVNPDYTQRLDPTEIVTVITQITVSV